MAILFSDYIRRSARSTLKADTIAARKFLISAMDKLDTTPVTGQEAELISDLRGLNIGQMFLFVYDAKIKEKLPYWDAHPLIFPIDISSDRFMGLNFHYLPVGYRIRLLDVLYDFTSNDPNPDKESLSMSYSILKNISRYRYFKPTVHIYLNIYVRSRFLFIPSNQWKKVLLAPVQNFRGARVGQIYADSLKKV